MLAGLFQATNWVFYHNITFLDDFWRADPDDLIVDETAATEVMDIVSREPGIRLDQLLRQLQSAGSDEVYIMLVKGQIYVDLNEYPLAEPQGVPVFRDQWRARAHIRGATDWHGVRLPRLMKAVWMRPERPTDLSFWIRALRWPTPYK